MDFKNSKYRNKKITQAIQLLAFLTLLVGLVVILGWFLHEKSLVTIIPTSATAKFNTAIALILTSLGVLCCSRNREKKPLVSGIIGATIFLIGGASFIQSIFSINLGIDTLFFPDPYSSISPGRMSPFTALCFICFGIGLYGRNSRAYKVRRVTQYVFFLIVLLSLTSILAFLLEIATNDQSNPFDIIPVHVALLFFFTAGLLSLKNATPASLNLIFGSNAGSRLIRTVIPYNFSMIVLFGFVFLYLINHDNIEVNFGMTAYTLLAVVAALSVIVVVGIKLNKSDIERENLSESLLKTNREMAQFKYALDESSLIAFTDPKGVITHVNDKFCEISKYSREELIGQTHRIVNSGHHSRDFFKDLWRKISSGKVWIGGIKNQAKDGTYYWVHTAIIPFKNERGEIYQYLAIRQDITRLTMLSSQYENLKLKNKEIEQFTYIASHDLQEPLRTVSNMVEILQHEHSDDLDQEAQLCLDFVMQATDRMSKLIKGLLDYSRIGGNRQLEIVDFNHIADIVQQDLSVSIIQSHATITVGPLPTLYAYPTEVRLLFQNLISNAIKFQKAGNRPQIHISTESQKDNWKISIADNGIGIANQSNRNVFAMFQRLNNRSDYEGTGIGLAHCEKIVHLHGGEIWVDSNTNEGSTFHFTISKHLD